MKNRLNNYKFLLALSALIILGSCGDDSDEPDVIEAPKASFTFEVNSENTLMVSFTDGSKDADTFAWDFGDDSGTSFEANPSYTYAAGGTYTVTLTVTNDGGTDDSSMEVIVTDPAAENLVTAGDMSDPSAWTILQLWVNADNAVDHAIADGEMRFANADGTLYSQSAFYQAIEVEAGGTYNFSAMVKGDGITNGWFELYFTSFEPYQAMEDAEFGQMQLFLKGYGENENCASGAFEGEISTVIANGCPLPENSAFDSNGNFTFTSDQVADGKTYMVFKVGSWDGNFGTGVILDDVSLTPIQ